VTDAKHKAAELQQLAGQGAMIHTWDWAEIARLCNSAAVLLIEQEGRLDFHSRAADEYERQHTEIRTVLGLSAEHEHVRSVDAIKALSLRLQAISKLIETPIAYPELVEQIDRIVSGESVVERLCSVVGCGKPVKGLVGATKCHEHVLEDFERLGE
jgi:hypothetical protein